MKWFHYVNMLSLVFLVYGVEGFSRHREEYGTWVTACVLWFATKIVVIFGMFTEDQKGIRPC